LLQELLGRQSAGGCKQFYSHLLVIIYSVFEE
jgi:hypothetical protein